MSYTERVQCGARAARPFLFALAAVLCAPAVAGAQSRSGDPTTGRVVYIDPSDPPGKLKVKQGPGQRHADATVGMPVRRGYLLTLDATARAVVVCPDGKRYDITPGPQGCPCTRADANVIYEGSTVPGTRGYDTKQGNFPAVVSPRKTSLLSTRPTLRWSPVAAPASAPPVAYSVAIFAEEGGPVWRREVVGATELAYPTDAEELKRGGVYKVVVQAGQKSSQQERVADLRFTVVTAEKAKEIADAEAAVRALKLPEGETQFLIANLYASHKLSSEAIEKVTALPAALKGPPVLRMLGDLYADAGLHREAAEQYQTALSLPQMQGDPEGQALTLAALGQSFLALGDPAQANPRFQQAIIAFRLLGETVTVKQLQEGFR